MHLIISLRHLSVTNGRIQIRSKEFERKLGLHMEKCSQYEAKKEEALCVSEIIIIASLIH